MKVKKVIEISLQNEEDVKSAVEFNKKNNLEYIIIDNNNLINYNNLIYLLRNNYTIQLFADNLTLIHKYCEEKR